MILYKNKTQCVISIHMNSYFEAVKPEDRSLVSGYLYAKTIAETIEFLNNNSFSEVFLDFDKIVGSDQRCFQDMMQLKNNNLKLYFINVLSDKIRQQITTELIDQAKGRNNFFLVEENRVDEYKKNVEIIVRAQLLDIINYISEDHSNMYIFLESSGVFSNCYIHVKKIFGKPELYKILLFQLIDKICKKYYHSDENVKLAFDYLVSSSLCGATLVSDLASYLCKPVIFFHNFGPKYALHNTSSISKIEKAKRYLYIYDFVCLGTEYKLTKGIIELCGGSFLGGIGIASFVEPKVSYREIQSGQVKIIEKDILNINSVIYMNNKYTGIHYDITGEQKPIGDSDE